MSTAFQLISQDLCEENNLQQTLQDPPYLDELDFGEKIKITYDCLLRAIRLKQRISSLIFAYFLGQLIERKELSKCIMKQIITEHYYIIAVKTYYIFEINPQQIYATKFMSTSLIRKLHQE